MSDVERAGLVVLEAVHDARRVAAELREEREKLEWAVERLRTERQALEDDQQAHIATLEAELAKHRPYGKPGCASFID